MVLRLLRWQGRSEFRRLSIDMTVLLRLTIPVPSQHRTPSCLVVQSLQHLRYFLLCLIPLLSFVSTSDCGSTAAQWCNLNKLAFVAAIKACLHDNRRTGYEPGTQRSPREVE